MPAPAPPTEPAVFDFTPHPTITPDIFVDAFAHRRAVNRESLEMKYLPRVPTEAMLLAAHDGPLMAGDHPLDEPSREWLAEMYEAFYLAYNHEVIIMRGHDVISAGKVDQAERTQTTTRPKGRGKGLGA
jgi:hypothetical protein